MATTTGGIAPRPFGIMPWLTTPGKPRDYVFIFLIVFGVLAFRRYDAFFYPQIWDEDGTFYLSGWEYFGIKSMLIPASGYWMSIGHIIACVFGLLGVNLLYIPLCYNLSVFFITFLVAIRLYNSAVCLGLRHKILYATCFLITPLGPDMFMNVTNVMWVTTLFLVDFVFVGYRHGNKYLNYLCLVVLCLSSPASLLISPIVVLVLFLERKDFFRQKLVDYGIILGCGAIQFFTMLSFGASPRYRSKIAIVPSMAQPPEKWHLLKFFTNNMSGAAFLTSREFKNVPELYVLIISVVLLALFALLLARSYRKITFPRKYVLAIAGTLFMASYVASFWPQESKLSAFTVSRYYFVCYTCMAWTFILAWDARIRLWHIALYLLFFLKHSGYMKSRLYDKQWKQQILEYYQGTRDTIYINEGGKDWGWQFALPKRK